MKQLLFLILLFKTQFLFAQQSNDTIITKQFGIDLVLQRKEKINAFSDSLNNYTHGVLPKFIFDKCFDDQPGLWEGFHSPVSLRWIVLEKVNNKQALQTILDSKDPRLKEKCIYLNDVYPHLVIPLIEESFYQLVLKRYNQIK